ncbi:MAG: hypothetical protein LUC44_06785, partial [Prevotellaceae bacterium]|nr:hypothetical protein [Prevotellaceae bacterium]
HFSPPSLSGPERLTNVCLNTFIIREMHRLISDTYHDIKARWKRDVISVFFPHIPQTFMGFIVAME